jgi:hypothetical protein
MITKETANDPIVGIAYVFPEEIESETRMSSIKVDIILKTGKTWKEIYFTPGSAMLTTQESTPFTGRLIESKFEMQIPGGSATELAAIVAMCGRPVVLSLTFMSGAVKVCGGKTRKLRLWDEGTSGTVANHKITFDYKSKKDFNFLDS